MYVLVVAGQSVAKLYLAAITKAYFHCNFMTIAHKLLPAVTACAAYFSTHFAVTNVYCT